MIAMVTGAAGFIGSTLSRRMLDDGHTVIGVDCLTEAYDVDLKARNLDGLIDRPDFQLICSDLSCSMPGPALEDVDVVYHLAGQASVTRSWGSHFADYTRHNITATQDLLGACVQAGVERVVFASSSSIYGDALTRPTTEATLPRPISPYGVSKLAAEALCLAFNREMGLPVTCLRYFTVYGPGQRPDMGMHRMFRAAHLGQRFRVRGDGSATRDYTFVDDAVEATYRAGLTDWDGVVNIGGGSPVALREVIDVVQEIAGPIDVEHGPTVPGDARDTAADIGLARDVLGYEPGTDLRTGLARMGAWAAELFTRETAAP